MREVPEQLKTLKRMSALRSRGLSYARIGARLMKEGRPPARAKSWSVPVVRTLVLREAETADDEGCANPSWRHGRTLADRSHRRQGGRVRL